MKRSKRNAVVSLILWIALVVLLAQAFGKNRAVSIQSAEEGMTVSTSSGFTISVIWKEIAAAEVKESLSLGTLVDGTDTENEKSGLWYSEEYGEYELAANAKVNCFIVCTKKDGQVLIFNYESASSTRELYEALIKAIQ
ncbi:MAG: hypothetical protein LUG93_15655 [Lachnospiraceae bacterium]|nr:hypothetical protein [Lachnospiraceae bacterium]